MEGSGVRKRRKYSKKSKRNLRKFTDVKDVEEFLEERRREERTGGPVSEKADAELFCIEREEGLEEEGGGPRRRVWRPLRCEANLLPDPPMQNTKRRKVQRVRGGKGGVTMATDSSSEEEPYAQLQRKQAAPRVQPVQCVERDLWEALECKAVPDDDHYLTVTGKKPVKRPPTLREKPSALRAVEIPPPGASYNPAFEDHQALLGSAVRVEEQRLKAAQDLERKLQLTPMTFQQREQVWLEEAMEGLYSDGEGESEGSGVEGESEGSGVEGEPQSSRPVRAGDRKTKKRRRRERERKEEERRKGLQKAERIREEEVLRLRSIKKEIVEREVAIAERKEKREEEEQRHAPFHTHRLGRYQYEDPEIAVQLSSEVTGSLRCLKPEGSIAEDRFKSLQSRNIIEPRELVRHHRKYKLKEKEKRSARLPEETGVQ